MSLGISLRRAGGLGVGAVGGVLDGSGSTGRNGPGGGALGDDGGGLHIGGGHVHIQAVDLGADDEGVVHEPTFGHIAIDAHGVLVDPQGLELHGVHGGVLVFDEEVDAGGEIHVGHPDNFHPVQLADHAVAHALGGRVLPFAQYY